MAERKKEVVPRLRFPEFRDAGPWEVQALEEVLYEHGETSNGTEEVYSVSVHKGVVNQIEHLGRRFAAQNTEQYNRVFPGDIIYTKSPTGDFPYGIVKQNKNKQTVIVSPLYGVFRPQTYAIGVLLDAYFESPARATIFLAPLVQKGAKNTINISNSRFLSGALPLPQDPAEQRKIADCLSSLDELIRLQAQKLDALRAYKKGLMQQLFPREGETTPRLRFPEFRDAGPWEVQALEEVLYEHGETSNGTEEVYSVSVHKGVVNQIEHLGRSFAAQNTEQYNRVFPGDIIYTKSPTGDFPYGIVKQNKNKQTVIVSPLYGVFRPQTYAIGVLLDAYFESPARATIFLAPLVQKGAKNTINISNSRFLSGPLPLPQDPAEQRKIADCLSSLDELIRLQAQKLDALRAYKKGLMQRLFPQEFG